MAEILGVVSSIIAVLQAANGAVKAIEKVSSARRAPKEVQELQDDMERLETITAIIKDHLERQPHLSHLAEQHILTELRRAEVVVRDLRQFVETHLVSAGKSKVRRVKFLWSDVKGDLSRLRSSISTTSQALQGATLFGLFTAASVHRELVKVTTLDMAQLDNDLQQRSPTTLLPLSSTEGQVIHSTRPLIPYRDAGVPANEEHATESFASSRGRPMRGSTFVLSTERSEWKRQVCDCMCHMPKQYHSPHLIGSVLGSLTVDCSVLPHFLNAPCKCTGYGCHKASQWSIKFRFPAWMWDNMIYMRGMTQQNSGPELLLRVYRVQPSQHFTHLIWGCESNQDVFVRVKCALAEGEVSALDVDSKGWSLLYAVAFYCLTFTGPRYNNFKKLPYECLKFLLELGLDSDLEDFSRISPYQLIWQDLLLHGYSTVKRSAEGRYFIDKLPFDEKRLKMSPLHLAIFELDDAPSFEQALARASRDAINSIDIYGGTALSWAVCLERPIDQINGLLSKGADPNVGTNHSILPAYSACRNHREDLLRLMLDSGALLHRSMNLAVGSSALLNSAISHACETTILECIVDHGGDVNGQDREGDTPILSLLSPYYETQVHEGRRIYQLRWLLSRGARTQVRAREGHSPLELAIQRDELSLLEILLDYDPRAPSGVDGRGWTLLHYAARCAGSPILQFLTGREITLDPLAVDEDGWTAWDVFVDRCEVEEECERLSEERYRHWLEYHSTERCLENNDECGEADDSGEADDCEESVDEELEWRSAFVALWNALEERESLRAAGRILQGEFVDMDALEEVETAPEMPGAFPAD